MQPGQHCDNSDSEFNKIIIFSWLQRLRIGDTEVQAAQHIDRMQLRYVGNAIYARHWTQNLETELHAQWRISPHLKAKEKRKESYKSVANSLKGPDSFSIIGSFARHWETNNRTDRDTQSRATSDSQLRLYKKSLYRATRDSRGKETWPSARMGRWCRKVRVKLASVVEG